MSAGAATATTGSPQGSPAGSIGIRLLDAPVADRIDPRARIYVVDHLAPGTTIHRRVQVSNTTTSPAHVTLYAAAATIARGSFLGAAGHMANELSNWTSVQPGSVDVTSGGTATALVTVTVPGNAAPGERYGVVWAEVRSAPNPAGGVVEVNRVGIRLYLSIGPGGAPAPAFTIDSLTAVRAPDGRPSVVASVHNTGGRALDMAGSLSLSAGPAGLNAGPFPASLGVTLAIGDTEPVTIALDPQLPPGPWNATITLRSGLIVHQAQATLTFPAAGVSGAAVTTTKSDPRWMAPLIALAGLLLAVVAWPALLRRRRRPRHALGATRAARPAPPATG